MNLFQAVAARRKESPVTVATTAVAARRKESPVTVAALVLVTAVIKDGKCE
jgi:hypothetical protein